MRLFGVRPQTAAETGADEIMPIHSSPKPGNGHNPAWQNAMRPTLYTA